MKAFFLIYTCLSLFFSISLLAQPENVSIVKEKGIDDLVSKHIYYNEIMKTIPGFRIQIFSDSGNFSKGNAVSERSRFMGRYPEVRAYIIFNTPYYIVRAGNFRTRNEAEALRQRIIVHYPEAYIVKDDIDLPTAD